MTIDLNVDCGEGGADDAAILAHVTSANVACGGHAGDARTMRDTVRLVGRLGVALGAHPGYADRANFGRKVLPLQPAEVRATVLAQIEALAAIAREEGFALRYVKTHGAMYNHAAVHPAFAEAIALGTRDFSRDVVMVGLAGSALIDAGRAAGLRVAAEAFADRAYEADGTLRARTLPGALIEDLDQALAQVIRIVREGAVISHDGARVPVRADTVCLHGDTPGAAARAVFLRAGLAAAGITVRAFA